jgi:oligo-alginate lyase
MSVPNLNRRQVLATLGAFAISPSAGSAAASAPGNYLMLDQTEIEAVLAKAKRCEWAATALQKLLTAADTTLAKPIDIPNRGGQWGHWYTCKKDGSTLIADSPTRHRCPRCNTVYTGEPYDSVYLNGIHAANSGAVRDLGLAFRFTGRPEFAARVGELLTGYAKRYSTYPRHDPYNKDSVNAARVGSQVLDESAWIVPMCWGYSLVRSTLSDEDRKLIERELLLGAADVIIGRSYARLPNIQCWKDAAIACIGFATGSDDLVSEALDHPVRGFRVLMNRFVLPGGLWYEASLGYHNYTLHALWGLAEAARHNGVDLYANEHYRSLFDGPLALAFPDGGVPGFNDNAGAPLATWAPVYELAYARWKREDYGRLLSTTKRTSLQALLYGADTVPSGSPIPKRSVLFREAGYAALRSPSVTVAARFGIHGSGHGHPDKLNILTFGAGKMFGVDPGSIGYGVPLFFQWHKATISHNTVSVDQTQQTNAGAKVLQWSSTANETVLEGEAQVYPGVVLRRYIRLRGNTLEDRFTCESKDEHTYDWLFHAQGVLETSLKPQSRKQPIATVSGYQHIRNVAEARTGTDWTARWKQGASLLTLRIKGAPGTTVFTGIGPGPDPAVDIPLILVRRRTVKTVFEVTHTFSS